MNINDMNRLKQDYMNEKMTDKQVMQMKKSIEDAKSKTRKSSADSTNIIKFAMPFAAAIALFIAVPNVSMQAAEAMSSIPIFGKLVEAVTFRDYKVETERQHADVEVPEVVVNETPSDNASDAAGEDAEMIAQQIAETTEDINAEIEAITEPFISEFKENMEREGYQDLIIRHETINTTEQYFTLKLICYQGAGSGTEWNYYYTIDLTTGERLVLKELFTDGADYITPISENIKIQMAEQMAADENISYWLDDPDMKEWNFQSITDETEFYLNESGNIVISFNEGDVAPMYMGVCTFEIPEEVVKDIRK